MVADLPEKDSSSSNKTSALIRTGDSSGKKSALKMAVLVVGRQTGTAGRR